MRRYCWIIITLIFLILTQSFAIASSGNASSNINDWTTFRYDQSHTGYISSNISVDFAKPVWNFSTDAPVTSSPSVVDGYVFLEAKITKSIA
ncbi:MAG: PQQ-binding-like beta-propeller repeat protein [Ignavibacteria bacterium]